MDQREHDGLKKVEKNLVEENHLIAERIRKLNDIKDKGINPYPYKFYQKNHSQEIKEKYAKLNPEEKTEEYVSIAGRVLGLRRLGKVTFMHIQDNDGRIQVFFSENDFPNYDTLKLYDMGDYIGIKGIVFKTKAGEVTVYAQEIEMLSKSLRPLPEKFHGLQDTEIKYRQRYLDLIMNESSKKTFLMRTKILKAIREFYDSRGFLEVETNTLEPIYGGAAAKPFTTHHNALDMKLYLRISLELHLKKLIAGGFEKVYEMGKVFRNEDIDTEHNPEFTLLESYAAYWDYNDVMEFVEDCYIHVALKVLGTTKLSYQGKEIDIKKPWARMTMKDAIKKFANIEVDSMNDQKIKELLSENKIDYTPGMSRGLLINQLFKVVEHELIQPVFIIDHPKETTPLCKLHRINPELIERFEPYINGWEIGNAYSELNDPIRQRYLLEEQAKQLREGSEESNPMDEDFCKAVDYGMPPMGGLGLGIDRMVMLFTNTTSIRDILFFPTMKNLDEKKQ